MTDLSSDASGDAWSIVDLSTIDVAAHRLARGLLVAFPTETVYGLGADAADAAAVARIFAAKGRPSDHPLIVHVAPKADAMQWARELPPLAMKLIDRFWPGPLTLILPRREGVGAAAAGGQDALGLRCPSHPVAQRLLRRHAELKRGAPAIGIAAPSANRFGRVSPTRAAHVLAEFDDASVSDVDADVFVIDGGDCEVGIESTIVDCSRIESLGPVLLRPGRITAALLAEVIGALPAAPDREAPRASGTLVAHYAPSTPVRLVDAAMLADVPEDVVVWSWSMPERRGDWCRAPDDASAYAHDLYAVLRDLDARGARAIWIEEPPSSAAWAGVRDRLMRAAAGSKTA